MYEYCILIGSRCPNAGLFKNILHCGLAIGSIYATRIASLRECPLKGKKKRKKRR